MIDHPQGPVTSTVLLFHAIESPPAALTDHDHASPAVTRLGLPLADVPLIVEGLLIEAKQLADGGTSTEAVEAILDHVAALREGRGGSTLISGASGTG